MNKKEKKEKNYSSNKFFSSKFVNKIKNYKNALTTKNRRDGKYGFNLLKSAYMYILVAIIVAFVNLNIIGNAINTGLLYYSYAINELVKCLIVALTIIASFMYTEKDLKDRIVAKRNSKLFKYFLAKTFRLFKVGVVISALTIFGLILINMFLSVKVGLGIIPVLGLFVVIATISLVNILVREAFLMLKKDVTLASVFALLSTLAVTIATINIFDNNISTQYSTYLGNFLEWTPFVLDVIGILVFIGIGFIVSKTDERELSFKPKVRIILKSSVIVYITAVIIVFSAISYLQREKKTGIYLGVLDLTSSKEYTLAPEVKDRLKKLDKKINVRYLFNDTVVENKIRILGKQAEKITDKIDFLNDRENVEAIKGPANETLLNNKIWFYRPDDKLNAPFVIDYPTESEVIKDYKKGTSYNMLNDLIIRAFDAVSLPDKTKKFMILDLYTGKNEENRMESNLSNLATFISRTGKDVIFSDLKNEKTLDEEGTVVIGAVPRDLNAKELKLLKDFTNKGGNLIIFKAPTEKKYKVSYNNLNSLIKEYGINIDDNKTVYDLKASKRTPIMVELTDKEKKENAKKSIYEGVRQKFMNEVIIPDINLKAVTSNILKQKFPNISPVTTYNGVIDILSDKVKKDNIKVTDILTTSEYGVSVPDPKPEHLRATNVDGNKGRFRLAVEVSKKVGKGKVSKLVAFSSYNIFTDQVTNTSAAVLGTDSIPLVQKRETEDLIKGMVDFVQDKNSNIVPKVKYNNVFRLDSENSIIKENPELAKESIYASHLNQETGKFGVLDIVILSYSTIIVFIGLIISVINNKGKVSNYEKLEKEVK